jgi:hypothetical protein
MKIKELISLIESSNDNFYTHIENKHFKTKMEVFFIENVWQYRIKAYEGTWILDSVDSILELVNIAIFEQMLADKILTEFVYLERFNENDIRKNIIMKQLGRTKCELALKQMEEFEQALVSAIKNIST